MALCWKPVLADLDKQFAKGSWHLFPEMNVNLGLARELRAMLDPSIPSSSSLAAEAGALQPRKRPSQRVLSSL
jgi:hypothetical protein